VDISCSRASRTANVQMCESTGMRTRRGWPRKQLFNYLWPTNWPCALLAISQWISNQRVALLAFSLPSA